jgi:hypothetical protein
MRDFREIFERHYFSNHHVEAIEVERRFESMFDGCQCVTFSSLPALIVAVKDEMTDPEGRLADLVRVNAGDAALGGLNRFLEASGRRALRALGSDEFERVRSASELPLVCAGLPARAILLAGATALGALFDLAALDPMLGSAGLFVTRDGAKAEKIRWSRSSYGRREQARIAIAANGRFSEFQGHLVNAALAGTGA